MLTYIGTFGVGHNLRQFYQPIEAENAVLAAKLMFAKHDTNWSTIYTLQEYKNCQDKGLFKGHQPLKVIGGERYEEHIYP